MGKNNKLPGDIQRRIDDIETEATRLMVFANQTYDTATGVQLKVVAKRILKSATAIERHLPNSHDENFKNRKSQGRRNGRRKRNLRNNAT